MVAVAVVVAEAEAEVAHVSTNAADGCLAVAGVSRKVAGT